VQVKHSEVSKMQ